MKRKLKYYGGQGFSYSNEVGKYEVKTDNKVESFNSLSEARKHYESLNESKAIWDLTGMAELLEAHF